MLKSLNTLILFTITGIVCFTIVTLMLTVQWQTASIIHGLQEDKAEDMLNAITRTVENTHLNIRFYRQEALARKKEELRDNVDIAVSVIKNLYQQEQNGAFTSQQAMNLAAQAVKSMRWAEDVGYFWINDTTLPVPKMIMHPTLPELNGQVLNNPEFYCARGKNENLFSAATDISLKEGEGYIDYLWPKPTPGGLLSSKQPKLSYVRLFKPWKWVVGSGVYIDDIEGEVNRRIEASIEELQTSFQKLRIGESSYMFIFNDENEILIHPKLKRGDGQGARAINPDTGNNIFDEIKQLAHEGGNSMEYHWSKPSSDPLKLYDKKLYVSFFEPLGWYICVSYYHDEINEPVNQLSRIMASLSALSIAIAILLSFVLGKILANPLKKLTKAAELIKQSGIDSADIPISGSIETRELGKILSQAITTIADNEKSLRESEKKYREVVENSNDAIFIVQDNKIAFANNRLFKLTGFSKKELKQMELSQFITPEHEELFDKASFTFPEHLRSSPSHNSIRLTAKDGTEHIALLSTVPVSWEGKPASLVCARDITEQKKLETALLQAQKMEAIGTLAGGIAHDFNNLLMGIQGRASLMSVDPAASQKTIEHCREIETYVQSASNLTKQLLGITRGGKYDPRPIDINKIVNNTAVMYGRTQKELNIASELHPSPLVVDADRHQIEQVLLNIYVNAAQAMPGGGELHLQTTDSPLDDQTATAHRISAGRYVQISITDTGTGMDQETLQKIFDPFFTTKEIGRGTGLGLASAFGIVKNHGGTITCYSELGKGSTFNIYLPLSSSQPEQEYSVEEHVIPGSENLLLVDDEQVILDVGRQMLEKLGYTIQTACGGFEALEIINQTGIELDLVIIDMIMPGMDGETLLYKIRELLPEIPVLLASGYALNRQARAIIEGGCNGFLQKPFNLSTISHKIREVLDCSSR